ncbi:putative E3 ubiquitin-protein ligase ARI1 isoform 1 [Hibiscus syriacus]|uniref:E3 ubiquitin-protein ligase ARI1 isoform 1 n=2 Tax=Hibiscus syriacus TaxID=106335 RepID=A0A6A2Z2B8_HIBSY|nr:putative E3 ubiquitin-protein ligase ARI1 isoform 1 [Hibiscus syriacus]
MGACISSTSSAKSGQTVGGGPSCVKRSSTAAKVVHMEGRVQEFRQSVQAKNIVSQNPGHFLCSSESMSIGTCVPHVPDEEELQPGQVYFLLPLSQSDKPLSLPDLCSLAIKATAGFGRHNVDLSSSNSKLILRKVANSLLTLFAN